MARKKEHMTKKELRALLPKKLNKLGEWYFSDDHDKLHLDFSGMTEKQQRYFWRLALK